TLDLLLNQALIQLVKAGLKKLGVHEPPEPPPTLEDLVFRLERRLGRVETEEVHRKKVMADAVTALQEAQGKMINPGDASSLDLIIASLQQNKIHPGGAGGVTGIAPKQPPSGAPVEEGADPEPEVHEAKLPRLKKSSH